VSCAACSIVIADPWASVVNKMTENEKDKIMKVNSPMASNSRLACCIQVRPVMNEMICVVGNNKSVDGEWFAGKVDDAF